MDRRDLELPRFPRSAGSHVWAIGRFLIVGLLVLGVALTYMSGAVVQAGNVGVVTTFGRVEPGVLLPGFHLLIPIAQRIIQVNTRVQPHNFKDIDAASAELQSVKLSGTMNYHLEQNRANDLYQNVGLDFAEKVIDPAFSDFIKEVVPQYRVTDILAKRDEIRNRARERLGENLQRYGIVVDDIYISNIMFSPEYQAAIERKQTAAQAVETEQQILAQKKIQADQALAEAQGQANAQIERARGEAQANQVRTTSITPQLVDYLRWTRWDGRLPMVTGDTQPLLQVPLPNPDASTPGGSSTSSGTGATAPAPAPTALPAPPARPTPAPSPTRR
ncbi:MAG: prohibitin family protein [Chloroflexi bacterium]|nr:prohibitin family protein [Chloroflexota bacterium]